MNLTVAISVLIAATGLTYLTAEALTDSLEGIGQTGSVSTEWLGLILLAMWVFHYCTIREWPSNLFY